MGADSLNVGEYWVDLVWAGSDLEYNQDAARQRLCDWCVRAVAYSTPDNIIILNVTPTKLLLRGHMRVWVSWRVCALTCVIAGVDGRVCLEDDEGLLWAHAPTCAELQE